MQCMSAVLVEKSSLEHTRKRKAPPAPELILDPVEAARAAGLRYVHDRQPGIHRVKRGEAFRFVGPDGKVVRDKETLGRIKSLVIPPAWQDVWITTHPKGHLQCTGRDARGRKQSRYHPHWREVRDETKYERMAYFAQALPIIRKRVEHDLALPGLPREKVLATIVRLMEETHIRVGNEEYARENKSYGLTTMRTKHVEVNGAKITFDFQGKSRVHHTIDLQDRRLAKIIKDISHLPGYELFQYVDHEGNRHGIDSGDVNEYLLYSKGFPHMGGVGALLRPSQCVRTCVNVDAGKEERSGGDQKGRVASGQYAVGLPQVLRASGGAGTIPGQHLHGAGEGAIGPRDRRREARDSRGKEGRGPALGGVAARGVGTDEPAAAAEFAGESRVSTLRPSLEKAP